MEVTRARIRLDSNIPRDREKVGHGGAGMGCPRWRWPKWMWWEFGGKRAIIMATQGGSGFQSSSLPGFTPGITSICKYII